MVARLSGAFDALVSGLENGTAYSNIHTTAFPVGEIRGFLAPVPEPQTYAMLLAGLAVLSVFLRRTGLVRPRLISGKSD